MSHGFDVVAIATKWGVPAADVRITPISHLLDGVEYESILLSSKQASKSTVIAVPNFFGIRQQALEIAANTIGANHAILIADVYGKAVRPTTADEALAAIIPLKQQRAELRKRMNAVVTALKEQKHVQINVDNLGACGFCFGGTAALELARSGTALKAFASIHGALDTPEPEDAKQIKGAILVLHGVQDPSVPRDQVNNFIDEMIAAKLDWQLLNYGEAGHSFTDPDANSPGFFYHRRTTQRASRALQDFFAEQLQ